MPPSLGNLSALAQLWLCESTDKVIVTVLVLCNDLELNLHTARADGIIYLSGTLPTLLGDLGLTQLQLCEFVLVH